MSQARCPGQDSRFLKPEEVTEVECPRCGRTAEFWPDELIRKCRACGHRLANPNSSMKCLNWCAHAAQCLAVMRGADGPDMEPLREEIVGRMRRRFGSDGGKIEHTLAVLRLAEEIGEHMGADPLIVIPAAILHDIGRADPQRNGGQAGARVQAAAVLADVDLPPAVKEEILDIVEHHHERDKMTSRNGSAVFDADLIVNLRGRESPGWDAVLAEGALTAAGRQIGVAYLAGEL